jgi:hypothetical protein
MEERTLTSNEMSNSQIATLKRAIRFAKNEHSMDDLTVRIRRNTFEAAGDKVRHVYANITVRRNDCEKYSPRRMLTTVDMLVVIGPRGGMQVMRAERGLGHDIKKYATKILGCSAVL